jgi:hypothetical protein
MSGQKKQKKLNNTPSEQVLLPRGYGKFPVAMVLPPGLAEIFDKPIDPGERLPAELKKERLRKGGKKISTKEHKARHETLHKNLDELVADFLDHTEALPSRTTVMELMEWSHQQTLSPTE